MIALGGSNTPIRTAGMTPYRSHRTNGSDRRLRYHDGYGGRRATQPPDGGGSAGEPRLYRRVYRRGVT
jgi:hypothetical protein